MKTRLTEVVVETANALAPSSHTWPGAPERIVYVPVTPFEVDTSVRLVPVTSPVA